MTMVLFLIYFFRYYVKSYLVIANIRYGKMKTKTISESTSPKFCETFRVRSAFLYMYMYDVLKHFRFYFIGKGHNNNYMYLSIAKLAPSFPAASLHCIYWFNVSWEVICLSSLLTTYHWESGIGKYLMLAINNRTQGKSRRDCLLIKLCEYLISYKRCLNVLIFCVNAIAHP